MRIPDIADEDDRLSTSYKLNLVMREYAKNMSHKYSYRNWLQRWEEPKQEYKEKIEIADNEILLGFSSLEYSRDNMVTAPLNIVEDIGGNLIAHPRLFIFIGEKGSGKSVLMNNIVLDNIVRKFGVNCLAIDPSPVGEYYMHKHSVMDMPFAPNTKSKINELLTDMNMEARGYSEIAYRPSFDSNFSEEGVDKDYIIGWRDFKVAFEHGTSKLEIVQSLLDILELGDSRATENVIIQLLAKQDINSLEQARLALTKSKEFESEDEIKNTSKSFGTYLRTAILLGVLNDKAETGNILSDLSTNDFVILRSKISNLDSSSPLQAKYYIYVNMLINKILTDRMRYISGIEAERKKAYLNNDYGIIIMIDEADTLCPRAKNTYTKTTIENLVLRQRKSGISVALATQNLANLSENLIGQADVIFASQLTMEENIKALRDRDVSANTIGILKKLNKGVTNSLGLKVSEWCYFDTKSGDLRTFYPMVPLSAWKMPTNFFIKSSIKN